MNVRVCKFLFLLALLLMHPALGSAEIDRDDWMASLPDGAPLCSLSIPGTHDAGTKGFSWSAECQRLSIEEQLNAGVRAFDLRPGVNGSKLNIYHSAFVHGDETLDDIFGTFEAFLSEHPGEFLFVFLKDETGSDSWAGLMKQVLDAHAGGLMELNHSMNMTVGQMRGKMLVLSRDSWGGGTYGAVRANSWQDNATFDMTYRGEYGDELLCRIQDIYDVSSSDRLSRKKTDIARLLGEAMAGTTKKFYINHTSGYTKSYLLSNQYVADCAAQCNQIALEYLSSHSGPTGVIMMDFAGTDSYSSYDTRGQLLVDAIIGNCQATASAPEAPGSEWVLPMGADLPWTGRVYRKDATASTSSAVNALKPPSTDWNSPDCDDSDWQEVTFPMGSPGYSLPYFTRWIGEYNTCWIRREFTIDRYTSLLRYMLRVYHDDDYRLYVNGTLVHSASDWTTDKPVERNITRYLKSGRNVIAAQVRQNTGGAYFDCGIYRSSELLDHLILDETSTSVPGNAICFSVTVNKVIQQSRWTPLCLPFNLTAEQIQELLGEGTEVREPCAFEPGGEEWLVAFDRVTSISAGRPCLVSVPADISSIELSPENGISVSTSTNRPIKLTDSATADQLTFMGFYAKGSAPEGSFLMSDDSFCPCTDAAGQNGLSACFQAKSADETEVKRIAYLLGDADAVSSVPADARPAYYDLSGRRTDKPRRGIYIRREPAGRTIKVLR